MNRLESRKRFSAESILSSLMFKWLVLQCLAVTDREGLKNIIKEQNNRHLFYSILDKKMFVLGLTAINLSRTNCLLIPSVRTAD
jgi:hypothetical protein